MSTVAARPPAIDAIAIATIGSLFAVALLWLFRPSVTGCAVLPPGGGCISYTESRVAIIGTVVVAVLYAAIVAVSLWVRKAPRMRLLVVLGVLICVVPVVAFALAFSNPFPVPEGVFP